MLNLSTDHPLIDPLSPLTRLPEAELAFDAMAQHVREIRGSMERLKPINWAGLVIVQGDALTELRAALQYLENLCIATSTTARERIETGDECFSARRPS